MLRQFSRRANDMCTAPRMYTHVINVIITEGRCFSHFADGNVVEIDAQIFDLGEEVDRAKSVPTEAQFKIGRRKETESASAATKSGGVAIHHLGLAHLIRYQSKGGFLSLNFNLLDDF
jgi:hypothetical protein